MTATTPPAEDQPGAASARIERQGESRPGPVAWLVFHHDDTYGLRVFASELDAYRAAHADRMEVVGVLDGESVTAARKRRDDEPA